MSFHIRPSRSDNVAPSHSWNSGNVRLPSGQILTPMMVRLIQELHDLGCGPGCLPCRFEEYYHRELAVEDFTDVLAQNYCPSAALPQTGVVYVCGLEIPMGVVNETLALLYSGEDDYFIERFIEYSYGVYLDSQLLAGIRDIADDQTAQAFLNGDGVVHLQPRRHIHHAGRHIGSLPTTPVTAREGQPRTEFLHTPPPLYSPARESGHPRQFAGLQMPRESDEPSFSPVPGSEEVRTLHLPPYGSGEVDVPLYSAPPLYDFERSDWDEVFREDRRRLRRMQPSRSLREVPSPPYGVGSLGLGQRNRTQINRAEQQRNLQSILTGEIERRELAEPASPGSSLTYSPSSTSSQAASRQQPLPLPLRSSLRPAAKALRLSSPPRRASRIPRPTTNGSSPTSASRSAVSATNSSGVSSSMASGSRLPSLANTVAHVHFENPSNEEPLPPYRRASTTARRRSDGWRWPATQSPAATLEAPGSAPLPQGQWVFLPNVPLSTPPAFSSPGWHRQPRNQGPAYISAPWSARTQNSPSPHVNAGHTTSPEGISPRTLSFPPSHTGLTATSPLSGTHGSRNNSTPPSASWGRHSHPWQALEIRRLPDETDARAQRRSTSPPRTDRPARGFRIVPSEFPGLFPYAHSEADSDNDNYAPPPEENYPPNRYTVIPRPERLYRRGAIIPDHVVQFLPEQNARRMSTASQSERLFQPANIHQAWGRPVFGIGAPLPSPTWSMSSSAYLDELDDISVLSRVPSMTSPAAETFVVDPSQNDDSDHSEVYTRISNAQALLDLYLRLNPGETRVVREELPRLQGMLDVLWRENEPGVHEEAPRNNLEASDDDVPGGQYRDHRRTPVTDTNTSRLHLPDQSSRSPRRNEGRTASDAPSHHPAMHTPTTSHHRRRNHGTRPIGSPPPRRSSHFRQHGRQGRFAGIDIEVHDPADFDGSETVNLDGYTMDNASSSRPHGADDDTARSPGRDDSPTVGRTSSG